MEVGWGKGWVVRMLLNHSTINQSKRCYWWYCLPKYGGWNSILGNEICEFVGTTIGTKEVVLSLEFHVEHIES